MWARHAFYRWLRREFRSRRADVRARTLLRMQGSGVAAELQHHA
jgi:hypothetical protein